MRLPVAVDEITANWLTDALGRRHGGVSVSDVRVAEAMHGTASKVRIHVTYAAGGDAMPPTLIVKGGFSAHRELMYREYMLEARFYAGVGTQASVGWCDGALRHGPVVAPDAINRALRFLGVQPQDGKDEFDTVGLGRRRSTDDWTREAKRP